ncbi:MAG: UDP-N-acetylglucosamine 1-carboxyvinyltransferase [Candidatus Caenarcaniphilales bacterium]|nr:UDP-N-acetylglucosamine 1-carboxyvinyltransferase [Candidatus Caenarcaniphilales bacterium]
MDSKIIVEHKNPSSKEVDSKSLEKQEKILVNGGNPLIGTVRISGAKNAVLKQIAACILVPAKVTIKEVPPLLDVFSMIELIEYLGGECEYKLESEVLSVDCTNINSSYAPYELVSRLRASFVVLGPLLGRMGHVKVSLPGGCQIGTRRVDLHEKGLKSLGAKLETSHGYVEATCPSGGLTGKEIYLDIPSNGATENLMMASVLAKGVTVIENAAKDPEIVDLANFLIACGAKIKGAGSQRIEIEGVKLQDLHAAEHETIPDRIEAGTFVIAALATKGNVLIENVAPSHLTSLLSKLEEMGAQIDSPKEKCLKVKYTNRLKAAELSTIWYPGFPTDLQPQMMALLSISEGTSIIKENIYEDRFSHIEDLTRMGADIQVTHNVAVMKGIEQLSGANVIGSDLRATAGLLIAALSADGASEVRGLHHLDRGYNDFTGKLKVLGADVKRVKLDI